MALAPKATPAAAGPDDQTNSEEARTKALAASPSEKLDQLRQLLRLSPLETKIGPRNRGREPSYKDSRFLCYVIDQRKVESILGELP